MKKSIKIALPKGRLLAETAALLQAAGWGLNDYTGETRLYHLKSSRFPNLFAKIFHEKDIPVQVAIGNYDLGICGLDWVEELLVKYPSSALVRVKELGYGSGSLYMTASRFIPRSIQEVQNSADIVRIASEYPNLAESVAARYRLRRFSIFPLWGAAEVYPPESADLALVSGGSDENSLSPELVAVSRVLDFSGFLVANRSSWETKDMSVILSAISGLSTPSTQPSVPLTRRLKAAKRQIYQPDDDIIRIALPDGHQQPPTLELLNKAGIELEGYAEGNRRPAVNLDRVTVKVIRPQDMPLQVANGNFDLAITGRDWLKNHLYQFPSSPVAELLDLKYGWVRIVAVVKEGLSISDVPGLRQFNTVRTMPFRVASEYVNIADKYARDNHLGMYRIIPTWGASEAFLPEDADLLIENTQTGRTLARHNLKIIDTLFESTACVIGRVNGQTNLVKENRIKDIIGKLRRAVEVK